MNDKTPKWKPIRILDKTSDEELAAAMAERLAFVFELYQFEPTPDGWRELALRLALKHEPALHIETPFDRQPGGGAEPTIDAFIYRSAMVAATKRLGTAKAASEEVSKKFPDAPSPAALRNLVTPAGRRKAQGPRQWRLDPYEMRAFQALSRAAALLARS